MNDLYNQNEKITVSADEWGVLSFNKHNIPYIAKPGKGFYFDTNYFVDHQVEFVNPRLRTVFQVALPEQIKTYSPTNKLPDFVFIEAPEVKPVTVATPSLKICVEDEKGDKVYYEYTYKKDGDNRPIYRRINEPKDEGVLVEPSTGISSKSARDIYLENLSKV